MGRRRKELTAALNMLIEMGILSMTAAGYDYESEEDFTQEDVHEAHLLLLRKCGLLDKCALTGQEYRR